MLAGFSAAILVGDLFLTFLKAGSDMDSAGYVIGVAGFALAQVFWTVGQLRESRPDWRVALALAIPLATFALVRLRPPVMPPAANAAVAAYSLLTALSFATALASIAGVWACLAREIGGGWRRILVGWGGALNAAGLCTIALVPFDVSGTIHNVGCHLATSGGALILIARFRKGADLVWTCWLVVLVIAFALCIDLKAIPFSPYVPTTQKMLIVSFAAWAGWVAWQMGGKTVGDFEDQRDIGVKVAE